MQMLACGIFGFLVVDKKGIVGDVSSFAHRVLQAVLSEVQESNYLVLGVL